MANDADVAGLAKPHQQDPSPASRERAIQRLAGEPLASLFNRRPTPADINANHPNPARRRLAESPQGLAAGGVGRHVGREIGREDKGRDQGEKTAPPPRRRKSS